MSCRVRGTRLPDARRIVQTAKKAACWGLGGLTVVGPPHSVKGYTVFRGYPYKAECPIGNEGTWPRRPGRLEQGRKMRRVSLIVMMMAIVGCGDAASVVNPEFQPYVDRFEEELAVTVDVRLKFKDEVWKLGGKRKVSACHAAKATKRPRIVMERGWWEGLEEWEKEKALFHELGHCGLGLPHMDEKDAEGEPVSLMHTTAWPTRAHYREHRAGYIEQMRRMASDPGTRCVWFLWRQCRNRP